MCGSSIIVCTFLITDLLLQVAHQRPNDSIREDFIGCVQISPLVTSEPYSNDFYAQVLTSLRAQKKDNFLKLATGDALALGPPIQRAPRRENAIQKMRAQMERFVGAAKNKENAKNAEGADCIAQNVDSE